MARIFGFDIGTTTIGSAVIDYDPVRGSGDILRLGVRVFPEARDTDGTPLNQTRRTKRLVRRQLRRRRQRRRALNEALFSAALLPAYGTAEWNAVMATEPLALRSRGLSNRLDAYELGRAIYHLAKRRHFRARDLAETDDEDSAANRETRQRRASIDSVLKQTGQTLGQFLATKGAHDRRRGIHANRSLVVAEFHRLWRVQAFFHASLREPDFRARIEKLIFTQRPVFWRKNTLGQCRFIPGAPLCPKGSWLSQQRRMLEKLNNLARIGGNARPLDQEERATILDKLQVRTSMSWHNVRSALKPLFNARGQPGGEQKLRFNLEQSESKLLGNAIEARLAAIFGKEWTKHPFRQEIRDAVHQRLGKSDYRQIGDQRIVVISEIERQQKRSDAAQTFVADFGMSPDSVAELRDLHLPPGWEPFSTEAFQQFLPHLEAGVKFGDLTSKPEWERWRAEAFPHRERPTGEILDRLPSPGYQGKDRWKRAVSAGEQRRLAALRNPAVIRTQNELRKVANNLISVYGKPDCIRIELAREVGKSKEHRKKCGPPYRETKGGVKLRLMTCRRGVSPNLLAMLSRNGFSGKNAGILTHIQTKQLNSRLCL